MPDNQMVYVLDLLMKDKTGGIGLIRGQYYLDTMLLISQGSWYLHQPAKLEVGQYFSQHHTYAVSCQGEAQ